MDDDEAVGTKEEVAVAVVVVAVVTVVAVGVAAAVTGVAVVVTGVTVMLMAAVDDPSTARARTTDRAAVVVLPPRSGSAR